MKTHICIMFWLAILILPAKSHAYEIKGVDIGLLGSIEEAYDDNITFVKNNPKEDFITSISPGITAKYKDKLKSWELAAILHRRMFAKNTDFDNTSQDVFFYFEDELSKYEKIALKNIFTHTYEPATFEEAFGRTSGRFSYSANDLAMEYIRKINKQLSLVAKYANEINIFGGGRFSDSFQNDIGIGADYSIAADTTLSSLYEFSMREFNSGRNAFENTLAGGIKQYITRQFYFDAKAGFNFIDSYTGKKYTRPLLLFSLVDEISRKNSVKLEFSKDSEKSPYIEDIFNFWKISPSLVSELTERLTLVASAFYGEGKYPASDIRDVLIGAEADWIYELTKKLKLSLSYAYSKINSNDVTREYNKTRISLGLRMEF